MITKPIWGENMQAEMIYIYLHDWTKCINSLTVSINLMHEGPWKHPAPFHLLWSSFRKTLGLLFISKQIDLHLKYVSIKQAQVMYQLILEHIKHPEWLKYKVNSKEGNLSMQKCPPCQLRPWKATYWLCLHIERLKRCYLLSWTWNWIFSLFIECFFKQNWKFHKCIYLNDTHCGN